MNVWMNILIHTCSEADSGLYTAKASNGPDSSTCSSQLIVRESECEIDKRRIPLNSSPTNPFNNFRMCFFFDIAESEEEKKSFVEQNTPYFAIRLTDTEVMENTFLRFMVKVLGEPRPKIQL